MVPHYTVITRIQASEMNRDCRVGTTFGRKAIALAYLIGPSSLTHTHKHHLHQ